MECHILGLGQPVPGGLKRVSVSVLEGKGEKAHGGGLENCGRRDCLVLLVGDGISDALLWF